MGWCGLLGLVSACASSPPLALQEEDFQGVPAAIVNTTPFVEQDSRNSAPTALYMMVKGLRPEIMLNDFDSLSRASADTNVTQQEMITVARQMFMAPYRVNTFSHIIGYLAQGNPVLVYQPSHYTVITGYNRFEKTFTVHQGDDAYDDVDMTDFLEDWKKGGNWAYVILPPDEMPGFSTSMQETLDEVRENYLAFRRFGF